MVSKKDETASFMIRFTQKIFQNEKGEPQIQWRGNIRHVQGGDEKRFSEFDDVVNFIQGKLADMTIQAMEDKSPEEQKGILEKSFDLWKKMAVTAPKVMLETIKDPKKQVAQLQDQIQDQIHQVSDAISQKLEDTKDNFEKKIEVNEWIAASKADNKSVMDMLQKMSQEIVALNKKVDQLAEKK